MIVIHSVLYQEICPFILYCVSVSEFYLEILTLAFLKKIMLMIRKFLFLIGATLLLSFAWHKYYVTITNVELNKKLKLLKLLLNLSGMI